MIRVRTRFDQICNQIRAGCLGEGRQVSEIGERKGAGLRLCSYWGQVWGAQGFAVSLFVGELRYEQELREGDSCLGHQGFPHGDPQG